VIDPIDSVNDSSTPDMSGVLESVAITHDECEAVYNAAVQSLFSAVDTVHSQCSGTLAECESSLHGAIERWHDGAAKVYGKCWDRLDSQLTQIMGEAYGRWAALGGEIPTLEQVVNNLDPDPSPSPTQETCVPGPSGFCYTTDVSDSNPQPVVNSTCPNCKKTVPPPGLQCNCKPGCKNCHVCDRKDGGGGGGGCDPGCNPVTDSAGNLIYCDCYGPPDGGGNTCPPGTTPVYGPDGLIIRCEPIKHDTGGGGGGSGECPQGTVKVCPPPDPIEGPQPCGCLPTPAQAEDGFAHPFWSGVVPPPESPGTPPLPDCCCDDTPPPADTCCPPQVDVKVDPKTDVKVNLDFKWPKIEFGGGTPEEPNPLDKATVNWNVYDICAVLNNELANDIDFGDNPAARIGFTGDPDDPHFPGGMQAMLQWLPNFAIKGIWCLVVGIFNAPIWLAKLYGANIQCPFPVLDSLRAVRWGYDTITKVTGVNTDQSVKPVQYEMDYLCPTKLPDQADVDAMYLADEIGLEQWVCYTRANGNLPNHFQFALNAKATKPNIGEATGLLFRGVIDEQQYNILLRANGVTVPEFPGWFKELAKFVPGPSDLVRFMVRDAFDEGVATEYNLDKDLPEKFIGKAEEWAKAQGMTVEQFKFYWRSHWNIPSDGQLFEMLHRLRPSKYGPPGKGSLGVDKKYVKRAIEVNDMAPEFVDKLMEISYQPLTRVDSQRAYMINAIDEAKLKESYLDIGYDDGNADTLVSFSRQLKEKQQSAAIGIPQPKDFIKRYINGFMDKEELYAELATFGYGNNLINRAIIEADESIKRASMVTCAKAYKKRYMAFQFEDSTGQSFLGDLGFDPKWAAEEVGRWACERDAKIRLIPAATLCKWYKSGILSIDNYVGALQRLGYEDAGIIGLVSQCDSELQQAIAKKLEAEAKKLAAEEEKARKEAEKHRHNLEMERAAEEKARNCGKKPKP
jgi:hypothetical protein